MTTTDGDEYRSTLAMIAGHYTRRLATGDARLATLLLRVGELGSARRAEVDRAIDRDLGDQRRSEGRLADALARLSAAGGLEAALRLCRASSAARLAAISAARAEHDATHHLIGGDQAPGWAFADDREPESPPCRNPCDSPTGAASGSGRPSPRPTTAAPTTPAPSAASPATADSPRSTSSATD